VAAVSVGIFGGAFDPPHVGHVELARVGTERFELDRLLVRVVEDPGHKEVSTSPQIRLFLADPVFLLGADEFAALSSWKDPERVLALARLGVATRPGFARSRLDEVLAGLERPDRVTFFEIEPLPVSSSEIRSRVAQGQPIDGLVPPAVRAEIDRLELYRRVDRPEDGGMLRGEPTEGTTPT